jgi:glycosyltransferase 2 family protein
MKNRTNFLQNAFTLLRFIFPVILIYWLLSKVDWKTVLPLIKQISWITIAGSAVLFFCSHLIFAFRWRYLLRLKNIFIPYLKLLGYVFISIFVSNFLPTTIGGDIVKMVGVAKDRVSDKGLAAASVIADRLYNLAGMAVLLPAAIAIIGTQVGLLHSSTNSGLTSSGVSIIPWIKNAWKRVLKLWESAKEWFTSPWCIINSLILSIISVGFNFAAFWLILEGVGIHISYLQAMSVSILSYFVSLIPIAINGLGVQESSITYLLVNLGAGTDQAIAAAFMIRIVTLAVSLLGGVWLIFGGRDLLSLARKSQEEKSNLDSNIR